MTPLIDTVVAYPVQDATVLDSAALLAIAMGGADDVGTRPPAHRPTVVTGAAVVGAWRSPDGMVQLRLHRDGTYDGAIAGRRREARGTYHLDGSSVLELPPLSGDLVQTKGVSREMVRIGTENMALLSLGPTLIRAKRQRDRWAFDAMTVGFGDDERFALRQSRDITYAGGRTALHISTRFADGSSEARLFPLQAGGDVFGASSAVPTQAQLLDGSLGCSPEQRQLPRLIAQPLPGTRHPVIVQDPVEPLRVFLS